MADEKDLKLILQKHIKELENSPLKKTIKTQIVQFLLKTLALDQNLVPLTQRVFELCPQ